MINFESAKKFCNEDISLIENYDKAISDQNQTWQCHHRREMTTSRKELIKIGEYFNRPASELIFLTEYEHKSLHFKGKPSWIKGKHLSEEHKKKLSIAGKARHHTKETKRKLSETLKGRVFTEEWKKKLSAASKGNKNALGKHHSEETKKKISALKKGNKNRLGQHLSEETKHKISEAMKGKNTWMKGLHWFNNGSINVQAKSCPDGFVKGRIKRKTQIAQ